MLQQAGEELRQVLAALEHQIGRVLGLGGHPVVRHRGQHVAQQRVHLARIAVQPRHPRQADKPIGEPLRPREVLEPQKRVVVLGIPHANTRAAELLGGERADEIRRRQSAAHPLGRMGEAEEIANAMLFLVPDQSSFITGAELVVDGGLLAHTGLPPFRTELP